MLIVSEQATEGVAAALDAIAKVILLTDAQKKRVLHDVADNKKFVPVPVAENLTWEEFARINMHLPYLSGHAARCRRDARLSLSAPNSSHVLGYVAAVSPEDMKDSDDPLLSLPGFRIGKRGIEKTYDRKCAAARVPAASRSTPMAA